MHLCAVCRWASLSLYLVENPNAVPGGSARVNPLAASVQSTARSGVYCRLAGAQQGQIWPSALHILPPFFAPSLSCLALLGVCQQAHVVCLAGLFVHNRLRVLWGAWGRLRLVAVYRRTAVGPR